MERLSSGQLMDYWKEGVNIVDARDPVLFAQGFLPGCFYSYPDRNFLFRVKSFLGSDDAVAIIADDSQFSQLAQLTENSGLKDVKGICSFNKEDFTESGASMDMIIDVSADEFAMDLKYDEKLVAVDLRSGQKYQLEHVKGSMSLPLMELADIVQIANLDDNRNIYFFSENDQDAMTAASILKRHGLHQMRIVSGGWELIRKNNMVVTEKVNASGN